VGCPFPLVGRQIPFKPADAAGIVTEPLHKLDG
jgi:hypothetical protein